MKALTAEQLREKGRLLMALKEDDGSPAEIQARMDGEVLVACLKEQASHYERRINILEWWIVVLAVACFVLSLALVAW